MSALLEHEIVADEPAVSSGPRTWPWTVLTFALVSLGRWLFSADRRVFHVSPDEPSQLAIARWLSGGNRWNMFDHATWQPGLGTLLTPIYWLTDDGATAVRLALGVNALLGGAAGAVLAVLVRRLTGIPAPWAALVAVIVALLPSQLSATSFVWAEGLVALCFLGTLLALVRAFETHSTAWAVAANLIAVAGYTSHSRLLPLVGTTVLLTLGHAAFRRDARRFVVVGLVTAAAFVASASWTRFILDNVWDDPSDQNTVDSVLERLRQPLAIAESLLGQVWYQLAATFGLAAFGVLVVVRSLRRPRRHDPRIDRIPTVAARLVVVVTAPLFLLSAVFMADRPRADQNIYGRYNDAIVWPIIAIGVVWLGRRAIVGFERRDRVAVGVVAAVTLATGVVVEVLHGDTIREDYGVRGMIAGILPYVDAADQLDVRRVTAGALIGLFALVGIARLATVERFSDTGRAAVLLIGAVAFVGVAAIGVTRLERTADLRLNGWARSAPVAEVDDLLPPGVTVGVKTVPTSQDPALDWVPQRQRYQVYQLYLPGRTFVRDRGIDDEHGPYVFAPLRDPELTDAGAEIVWRDEAALVALYVEPRP